MRDIEQMTEHQWVKDVRAKQNEEDRYWTDLRDSLPDQDKIVIQSDSLLEKGELQQLVD